MKQKSQNRFLAALLAVAMMLQMLPMLAFAEDAPGTGEVRNKRTGKTYTSLVTAVTEAGSGDTIELGEGNYTLFEKKNNHAKAGNKDLTFVGQGPDKTAWNIGDEVPDPSKYGTEYNGDYSFDGAGKITFKNMTLRSGKVDYLGFIRAIILWWKTALSTARQTIGAIPVQCSLIRPSMLQKDNMRSGRIAPRP